MPVIGSIISKEKITFINGCQILDDILIASELVDEDPKKIKNNYL